MYTVNQVRVDKHLRYEYILTRYSYIFTTDNDNNAIGVSL